MSWRVGFQKVFASLTKTFRYNSSSWLLEIEMPFYAVAKGRTVGIYMTWPDCEAQVKGYSGARYKKFDTAADAQNFIQIIGGGTGGQSAAKPKPTYPSASAPANSNLKRSFSTSSHVQNNGDRSNRQTSKTSKNKPRKSSDSEESETFTDEDDDLNTILSKQLDDVEKRLKGFERGVDKIIKKSQGSGRKAIMIAPPEPKKMRISSKQDFDIDEHGFVQVYTDGACSANGQNGARAGLGVYWNEGHPLNASEPVSGRATNNCGEIQAATKAMKLALQNGVQKLTINTDSQFLINSVTKWMPGWKKKGWKLRSGEAVKNEIDFKDLDSVQNKLEVKWNYVEAHRGVHGNEMADQLAKAGASKYINK